MSRPVGASLGAGWAGTGAGAGATAGAGVAATAGCGAAAWATGTTGTAATGGGASCLNHISSLSVRAVSCWTSISTIERASIREGFTPAMPAGRRDGAAVGGAPGVSASQRWISPALSRPCVSTWTSASPASDATCSAPSGRRRSHFCQRAESGGVSADRARSHPGPTAMSVPGSPGGPGV